MNRIVLKSKVRSDGVLELRIPLGEQDAEREVQVTVEPIVASESMADAWRKAILSTAGGWEGELRRPEAGEFEQREPL